MKTVYKKRQAVYSPAYDFFLEHRQQDMSQTHTENQDRFKIIPIDQSVSFYRIFHSLICFLLLESIFLLFDQRQSGRIIYS